MDAYETMLGSPYAADVPRSLTDPWVIVFTSPDGEVEIHGLFRTAEDALAWEDRESDAPAGYRADAVQVHQASTDWLA